jgi:hypothetical protein
MFLFVLCDAYFDLSNSISHIFCIEEPKVLISGNDFYASPRIDQTKKRMAWIEWGHPNMAWDKSELWVGYFSESG